MRCNIARSIAGGGGGVIIGNYTGNGATTKREITLPGTPTAMLLQDGQYSGNNFLLQQGDYFEQSYSNGEEYVSLSGNTLTVKGRNPGTGYKGYNASNIKYAYVLLM